MNNYYWLSALLLMLILFAGGCATPSSPTGGPPDEEGPTILRTEPETGTTNFSRRSIILHFSEFVERSTLRQAIIIEPGIGISYELDWGRKSVAIEFDEELPELTTVIVTIGTEFQDVNGNDLAEPQKIAVSTGPEIDEGKLFANIINARTGEVDKEQRVLLYRKPFDLSKPANYVASTDTSGTVQFSYLREGTYKAFWVDDRNRNKIWDQQQERAQPFGQEFIELAKSGTDTLGTLYTTSVDTTRPVLQGVGLFSSQRMRMRFSENIQLTDSTSLTVTDTLGNRIEDAYPLYITPSEKFILFAHSESALDPESSYSLDVQGIVDMGDNALSTAIPSFTGSAQEDTTQQRIVKRNTTSGYFPKDPFEITYAKPISEQAISDSIKVVEGDTLLEKWPNVNVEQNVLGISPQEQWKEGLTYEIRVWDPIVEDYRKFQPDIWHQSQLGALNVVAEDSTLKNIRLRIEHEESGIRRDTTFSGQIEITDLPPQNYKVIAYVDANNNEVWDLGQVDPYRSPESYMIQKNVPVKQNMTGDLTIAFK